MRVDEGLPSSIQAGGGCDAGGARSFPRALTGNHGFGEPFGSLSEVEWPCD